MKSLQFKSIDLSKYNELTVDKQPTAEEIKTIVEAYVNYLHPTHVAIAVPLDQNEDFLAHRHVPSPLTVDEFTRAWIDAIHETGTNVYLKGTFCGIKNMYDFGFDKTTPPGTADTAAFDNGNTWMGRTYQWLNMHLGSIKQNDILGIIPDTTSALKENNLFLPKSSQQSNQQAEFLSFFLELKKLCDLMTAFKKVNTGLTSNMYEDIASGWIPGFSFGFTGNLSISYYNKGQSPQEIEQQLNEFYTLYHLPIFLNGWSMPPSSLLVTDPNLVATEYFETFSRLREKGILTGVNYNDGLDFSDGIFTDNKLNAQGELLSAFFDQGGQTQPNPELKKKEEPIAKVNGVHVSEIKEKPIEVVSEEVKPSELLEGLKPKAKSKRKKKIEEPKKVEEEIEVKPAINVKVITPPDPLKSKDGYGLHETDIPLLVKIALYVILGASATQFTNVLSNFSLTSFVPYFIIVYTILVAVAHAILDGK